MSTTIVIEGWGEGLSFFFFPFILGNFEKNWDENYSIEDHSIVSGGLLSGGIVLLFLFSSENWDVFSWCYGIKHPKSPFALLHFC